MLRLVSVVLGLAPLIIPAAADRLKMRANAPYLRQIRDSVANGTGARSRIALIFSRFEGSASCSEEFSRLTELAREMATLRAHVGAVVSQPEKQVRRVCPEATRGLDVLYDDTRQVADGFAAEQKLTGVLIDENGIVRRIVTAAGDFDGELMKQVRLWLAGKDVYEANCARCHGSAGQDTTYSGVKSLAGIGNRMDESEILRRTSLTGAVDMSGWTDEQSRALAAYVAGL
jgi:peroxiredoxin